jgi:hypothetical protein
MSHEPEAFYHGLMLGLAASLDGKYYDLKSNHESGYGRYDIAIIAKTPRKHSIIMELKLADKAKGIREDDEEALNSLLKQQASLALEQIDERQYGEGLAEQNNLVKIGIAFYGKRFEIAYKISSF